MPEKNFYDTQPEISNNESFIKNLYCDEISWGFLVTSHRKKLWNVQIGLINELARICDKYNIKWIAYGGTLLGAARHKGFIPWDDDVDIAMLRPDYEKFKQVAEKEIQYPYFLDNWYNHRLESDELLGIKSDNNLPLITFENQKKQWVGYPACTMMKLRDSRTTMIEFPDRVKVNQGIWIDIAPFDPIPPFSENEQSVVFEIAKTILMATIHPEFIINSLRNGRKFPIPQKELEYMLQLPYQTKGIIYDKFVLENFSKSSYVGFIDEHCYHLQSYVSFKTKFFDESIQMPFEKIQVPVSVDWDEMLTSQFGDWRTPKIFQTHNVSIYSADIPYDESYKKIQYAD